MSESHELALQTMNLIKDSLTRTVTAYVGALKDGKISPAEGMQLAMNTLLMGNLVWQCISGLTPTSGQDFLWVLRHGHWELPPVQPVP